MPTLDLTNDQAATLFRQLPEPQQIKIVSEVSAMSWQRREELRQEGVAAMRRMCAERGLDFDTMSDDERLDFVNELVHEDLE